MASEDLYELRNAFILGNYNQIINEAPGIQPSGHAKNSNEIVAERDALIAKAQISLRRYSAAIKDLEGSPDRTHKALVLLAEYLKAETGFAEKSKSIESVKKLVDDAMREDGEAGEKSASLVVVASTLLIHAGEFSTAHMWLKNWIQTLSKKSDPNEGASFGINSLLLDLHSLLVNIYLSLNRIEHAETELRAMEKIDEDAPSSMLWRAWTNLRKTDNDAQEALKNFNELKDKYGNTPLLLNGAALCHMVRREFLEASRILDEALAIRDSDPDVLINHLICQKQIRSGSDNKAMFDLLKSRATGGHPWITEYNRLEDGFENVATMVGNL